MVADMPDLGLEAEKEAWDWMERNHPSFLDKIEANIKRGYTPEDMAVFLRRKMGDNRDDFILRCQNAALYLIAMKQT